MLASDIIATLGLKPHPEGGWYSETFRDAGPEARGHSTAIYFLLQQGEKSHWHRVLDAVELWHYYLGAPLKLKLSATGEETREIVLGGDILRGERPQAVVPAGWWQAAETTGSFTLVGCTVAPGFDFSSFELAAPGWQPKA